MCRPSGIESSTRKPAPSYKSPRARIRVSGIPVAAHPPHVMNIFTLIGRLGIFHLPCSLCQPPADALSPHGYFIYIDGTCLSRRPVRYSFRRESVARGDSTSISSLMILSIFLHRYPNVPVPVFQFALSYFASRIISKFRSFSEDPRLMERCSGGNYSIWFSGWRFEISENVSPVKSYCFYYITVAGFRR